MLIIMHNRRFEDIEGEPITWLDRIVNDMDFTGQSFYNAGFFNVRFNRCDFSNVKWYGSYLKDVEFVDCRGVTYDDFDKCLYYRDVDIR